MRRINKRLKAIIFLTIILAFLSIGFLPLQTTYAQSIAMDHGTSSMKTVTGSESNCTGPCGSATIVLKDKQKAPAEDQEDEPEPPQTPPYYQSSVYAVPSKLASSYLGGEPITWSPELVILYANFRF